MPNQNEIMQISVFDKEKYTEFERNKLEKSLQSRQEETVALLYRVFLPLNPYSVTFSKPRSATFQQTIAPRRFVILDWGMDMLSLTVRGQTGRLLPIKIPVVGYKDFREFVEVENLTYEQLISLPLNLPDTTGGLNYLVGDIIFNRALDAIMDDIKNKLLQDVNFQKFSNFRFLMFKLLEYIYQKFDANTQMMRLDWMRKQYWGIITDLSHTLDTGSLWNIKYEFTFKYLPEISFFEDLKYQEELIKQGA